MRRVAAARLSPAASSSAAARLAAGLRHHTLLLLVALGMLGLAACSGKDATAPLDGGGPAGTAGGGKKAVGPPARGDWLVTRVQSEIKNANPIVEQEVHEGYVIDNAQPSLWGSEFDCDVEYPPYLGESRELSPDGHTLTVHLRKDAVWSDGQPITAEDFLFSYDLYADPVVASPRISYTEHMQRTAPDPHTLVLHYEEQLPLRTMLFRSGLNLVPKHILEKADRGALRGDPFNLKPTVGGAFRVAEMNAERTVLERNENSTLKSQPYLDRVVFRVIKEQTTALSEIRTGGIDMMELNTLDPISELRKSNPEIRVVKRGWRFLDYIAWNTKDPKAVRAASEKAGRGKAVDIATVPPHPLFGSAKVRRALTMAIDRDAIIAGLMTVDGESYGRPATGTITPELCHDYDDSIKPLPFDPEGAKALLAEEGWKDSDGDTVLDKNGKKFSFTLNYNSGNQRRERGCVIVQSMLNKVGVEAKIAPLEGNVLFDNLRKKDFDASFSGWSAALVTDPKDIWHSGFKYVFNFTSYSNPRVDEIIDTAEHELDDAKRREMWREMQRLIYDEQPYTFLFWMNQPVLIHERFQDAKINVLSMYKDLETWWVPADRQKWTKPGAAPPAAAGGAAAPAGAAAAPPKP